MKLLQEATRNLMWAVAVLTLTGASTLGQNGQIGARAVTHQDIADYGLPPDTQISGGLFTVGLGQPVYLEAQVDIAIPAANILGVNWVITNKPPGSAAILANSPLGTNIPIYSVGDREVYRVASRKLLRPDLAGAYRVIATVMTTTTNFALSADVTGGTYLSAYTCAFCHTATPGIPSKFPGWSTTGHASFFTEAIDGLKSSHYNANCIQCHTVGYDTHTNAVNGGFDDVAAQVGWTFPLSLTNGNWAAMPDDLQEVANIQCENCHGAGSEHATEALFNPENSKKFISKSFSSGDCAQCHAEEPYHFKPLEWENSKHAIATRYPTGENRASCVRCHSGIGFVDYVNNTTPPRTGYEAITCASCHDPHNAANPHQLRTLQDVTLMDGITTITNGGMGKLCMNCHISRYDAVSYVETQSGSSRFGPHHGPQTDMLVGANAVTYGKTVPSSAHRDVVPNLCVTCHLQETALNDPAHLQVGGHTFRPGWDSGTPNDPSDDVHLTGACVECHGQIESFDFTRQDYDGDGIIEGVQTEVHGLLEQLGKLLPPLGSPEVSITSSYTRPQLRAAYNYLFVEEDGSFGVHNLSYAVGLLKASIIDLTDDFDHDGLSDTWEIANFGSITAYDGTGDPDGDGANNALELAAGTNPNLVDTDGDGVSDWTELQSGSDPLNAADKPGLVVKIFTAAEIEFATEPGKNYQIQTVSEMGSSWMNVGDPVAGDGGLVSYATSTRTPGGKGFFRVVVVP